MKLLIAEDETMCLDALRSLDWESVGIDSVICAKDGETAYSLALSEKADIILSDIQMPKISGLELAERLSVILPESRFIILTAYNRFDYAQSAISSGVCAYILKPFLDNEVTDAVKAAAKSIREETEKNLFNEQTAQQLETSKYFLLNYFLNTVSDKTADNDLYNIFRPVRTDFVCTAAVISLDKREKKEFFKENFRIFKHLISIFSRFNAEFLPFFNMTKLVFFFLSESKTEPRTATDKVLEYTAAAEKYLGSNYSDKWVIGIGNPVRELSGCELSYRGALTAINYSFYLGGNCSICISDLERSETLADYSLFSYKEFDGYVKANAAENAMDMLKTLFGVFRKNTEPIETVQRICHEIIVHLSICMMQCGQDPNLVFKKTNIWDVIRRYDSIDALEKFSTDIIDVTCSSIAFCHEQKGADLIQEIKNYIAENPNVTLSSISDHFSYSPNYISKIFSKKTGITIKSYLVNERIEAAKRLLTDTDASIGDIAEQVGYTSIPHFSTAFSAKTGVTPSEYRKGI